MKALQHIFKLTLVIILIASFASCKKDSSDDGSGPGNSTKGSYSFAGSTTLTTKGDYLFSDKDAYLFVYGSQATDILQFIFPGTGNIIPTGIFTCADRYAKEYDAKRNFAGGSVTSAQNPGSVAITNGKVSISKTDDGYLIEFDCATKAGQVKGSYKGSFVAR
jgi:hypothetical protein